MHQQTEATSAIGTRPQQAGTGPIAKATTVSRLTRSSARMSRPVSGVASAAITAAQEVAYV
ncbi:hypothetical protein D3C81_1626180 [compost metagenome]